MNILRAVAVLLLALPLILVLAVVQSFALRFAPSLSKRIPIWINRIILVALGVRLHVRGEPDARRPLLLVANHVSWLDIPVLFALAPVRFVAKSEVADWPVIGWMARLARTLFIERGNHGAVKDKAREVEEALRAGDLVVIFPEGTTSDGNRVLFFKSGLLGAVREAMEDDQLDVQPLAITHTHASGLPLGRANRHHAAYPGGVRLGDSLLRVLREGSLDIAIDWGEALLYPPGVHRKDYAELLERRVRAMFGARLSDSASLPSRASTWSPIARPAPPIGATEAAE